MKMSFDQVNTYILDHSISAREDGISIAGDWKIDLP
jgi:hypothetical protein